MGHGQVAEAPIDDVNKCPTAIILGFACGGGRARARARACCPCSLWVRGASRLPRDFSTGRTRRVERDASKISGRPSAAHNEHRASINQRTRHDRITTALAAPCKKGKKHRAEPVPSRFFDSTRNLRTAQPSPPRTRGCVNLAQRDCSR